MATESYHPACNSMDETIPRCFCFSDGWFLQLFYEDAINAAQILEISLNESE